MTRMSFALLLALAGSCAYAQQIATPAEAFSAGQDFAKTGKTTAQGKVNSATGGAEVPHYNTNAAESSHYSGGRNLLGDVGTQKINTCATVQSADAYAQQECDAVNFLNREHTTRPQYTIDKTTDPLMTGSRSVIADPGSVAGSSTQQCRVVREVTPGTYIEETCTESMTTEVVKCRRGFSPEFGVVTTTDNDSASVSVSVGGYTSYTYTKTFNIPDDATSIYAVITWYYADNYGQIWINDHQVYSNNIFGGDLRGSQITYQSYPEGWGGYMALVYANGSSTYFYDDGCNWGCRGVSPNADISYAFRKGQNVVTFVGLNAQGPNGMGFNVRLQVTKTAITGSIVNNQCEPLEQRAR